MGFIVGDPSGQNLAFPGARRRLETFELLDRGGERFGPFPSRRRRDVLPAEQKPQEVARGRGLDFGAQTIDRVPVNARKQSALTPFLRVRARREAAAHRESLRLQRRERRRDLAGLQPERGGERQRRNRPQALQPAAQDLAQRGLARPGFIEAL